MQGKKTHEQQRRILERKSDVPDRRQTEAAARDAGHAAGPHAAKHEGEFPVSRGGVHQESDHNKHNHHGQSGHKPQQHGPAEEKN